MLRGVAIPTLARVIQRGFLHALASPSLRASSPHVMLAMACLPAADMRCKTGLSATAHLSPMWPNRCCERSRSRSVTLSQRGPHDRLSLTVPSLSTLIIRLSVAMPRSTSTCIRNDRCLRHKVSVQVTLRDASPDGVDQLGTQGGYKRA